MMKRLIAVIACNALLLTAASTAADTLQIPVGQQAAQASSSLPLRGTSTHNVLRHFGEPGRRHTPVGQPPITRWDYADFSVYFEYDHVVHSVRHHRPTQSSQ